MHLNIAQADFSKNGVVVLRGVFTDWIDKLREGVHLNEQHPGPWFRNYTPDQTDGTFWGDFCNWQRLAPYRDFVEQGPIARIGKALMQSERVRMFHEHVLVKNAGSSKATPWHHDSPYYCVQARQSVSIWIPLDPVSRDSSIEFVAGSHRWGKMYRPQKFSGQYYDHSSQSLEILPDINGNRDKFDILGWELEPGDAVAFDYCTIHGAPGNLSRDHARRAVSIRLLGDDAVYADRGGITSPPYPQLVGKLKDGDPLPEDEFPYLL